MTKRTKTGQVMLPTINVLKESFGPRFTKAVERFHQPNYGHTVTCTESGGTVLCRDVQLESSYARASFGVMAHDDGQATVYLHNYDKDKPLSEADHFKLNDAEMELLVALWENAKAVRTGTACCECGGPIGPDAISSIEGRGRLCAGCDPLSTAAMGEYSLAEALDI